MANLTPRKFEVTAGDVLFALTGLAVALALAWISVDLLCGGRLTAAVAGDGGGLRVVGKETDAGSGGCADCG
jgi:hypothetical protein